MTGMAGDGELLNFYEKHLREVIVPFWLRRAIDRRRGGYYTCFDNEGRQLTATDKFTWAQGRFAWVLARLFEHYPREREYLELARRGVDFLLDHAFLPGGRCAFLLDENGRPREMRPGAGLQAGFYADCFVVIGLAGYAAAAGDDRVLGRALALYEAVMADLDAGTLHTEPYPVPRGYRVHGVPMIALNTGQELAAALGRAGDARAESVQSRNEAFADEIMTVFAREKIILEMVGTDGRPVDSLLGNYINPGHTIESMWFIIHHALERNDRRLVEAAAGFARRALQLGWDAEHGGLFQYLHRDGGPPAGDARGLEGAPMAEKVRRNWDNKLWWPHSEALYTFLLAGHLTGEEACRDDHDRVFAYTFKTFPNPDREIGEWIQVRDRRGRPEDKVMALPVKDPYHVARNLLLIIELLSGRGPDRENRPPGAGQRHPEKRP